jgi:hypothetical protein
MLMKGAAVMVGFVQENAATQTKDSKKKQDGV